MMVCLSWKHRTRLVSIAANGNYGFNLLLQKLVQVFRAVSRDVDANLLHHLDSQWVHVTCGFRAGTLDVEVRSQRCLKNPLCQVTATGVAGAENQDSRFPVH